MIKIGYQNEQYVQGVNWILNIFKGKHYTDWPKKMFSAAIQENGWN